MIDDFLAYQIIEIICNQWGDTGKGKIAGYLAEKWSDVVARGTGGPNAGHTVVINGKQWIFNHLPAGILNDKDGKITILGNGMVINPQKLVDKELATLDLQGLTYNNLMISEDAQIIMPYHLEQDKSNISQKDGNIGSTGNGIGPCYADKAARKGIMVKDLYNKDVLAKKIQAAESHHRQKFDTDLIMGYLQPYAEKLKPFVRDTINEMHNFVKQDKKILIEGAQGLLLSIDFGTKPYVTSSDPSMNGTATGVGIPANIVDLVLGIVKFPYMTRVGAGPFPTEIGGKRSEQHCSEDNGYKWVVRNELQHYGIPFEEVDGICNYDINDSKINDLVNSKDEFEQGIGLRFKGKEYGASTTRPRRTGWTDLVALKYAVNINGPNIVLTKPDVLRGAQEFKLGIGYDKSETFTRDSEKLRDCKVEYQAFKGFQEDISGIKDYKDLPSSLQESIEFMERFTGANVRMISTGPDQEQTIIKK